MAAPACLHSPRSATSRLQRPDILTPQRSAPPASSSHPSTFYTPLVTGASRRFQSPFPNPSPPLSTASALHRLTSPHESTQSARSLPRPPLFAAPLRSLFLARAPRSLPYIIPATIPGFRSPAPSQTIFAATL